MWKNLSFVMCWKEVQCKVWGWRWAREKILINFSSVLQHETEPPGVDGNRSELADARGRRSTKENEKLTFSIIERGKFFIPNMTLSHITTKRTFVLPHTQRDDILMEKQWICWRENIWDVETKHISVIYEFLGASFAFRKLCDGIKLFLRGIQIYL